MTPERPEPANEVQKLAQTLGPGLITGAADDDPSGIATYSQAGAQFGLQMLWTVVVTLPLMIAVQIVAARIGRVTGRGLAASVRELYPRWVLLSLVALLLVANVINIAADLAAMGAAADLVLPGDFQRVYTIAFGVLALVLEIILPYDRYVRLLKWLTLTLLAYVAIIFAVDIPWGQVWRATLLPRISLDHDSVTMIVAVFGTTISPYMFFWQSSQEVEEIENEAAEKPLKTAPSQARSAFRQIRLDTGLGMLFSNAIAFFIMLTAAVTLHAHDVGTIETAADAAEALRPIAGDFAFTLFALGIIGTGMLAIPVLAGSAAYAVAEAMGWRSGLARTVKEARGFYAVIALATVVGMGITFTDIDPIHALVGAAVINGVTAPIILAATMVIASRPSVMGRFTLTPLHKLFGWLATLVMAVAAIALIPGLVRS